MAGGDSKRASVESGADGGVCGCSHEIKLLGEGLVFTDELSVSPGDSTCPGGDAVETVDGTTKEVDCHMHLAEDTVVGFERTGSGVESSCAAGTVQPSSTLPVEKWPVHVADVGSGLS